MNTVQAVDTAGFHISRDDLVGEHHEVLDESMALQPFTPQDVDRVAALVEHHTRLRYLEVERPSSGAARSHAASEIVERADGVVDLGRYRSAAIQHGLGLLIGQPVRAPDACPLIPATIDLSRQVEFDEDRYREPVHAPHQRAHVGREGLGQHRDGSVDQIYAGPASQRLDVDHAPFRHEVGDICNVHTHLESSPAQLGHREGVVVVLGIRGVDREHQQIRTVDPPVRGTRPRLWHASLCGLLGGSRHLGWKVEGEAKAVSDRQHVDPGVRQGPEHLDHRSRHRARGAPPPFSVPIQPDDDHVPVVSLAAGVPGHEHVL